MNNELVPIEKELILNKESTLLLVKKRNEYTKLHLKKEISPLLLRGFNNVKELVIDGNGSYARRTNENKIYKLPFINNVENLVFKNIKELGFGYSYETYELVAPNIKSIEFPANVDNIYCHYLLWTSSLEKILFNIDYNTNGIFRSKYDRNPLALNSDNIKEIILKTKFNTYNIDLDYIPNNINEIKYSDELGIILKYSNMAVNTEVNIQNGIYTKTNTLVTICDNMIKDGCLHIPDYINDLNINSISFDKTIDSISLNIELLKNIKDTQSLSRFIPNLKSIILRTKEMSLFPTMEFSEIEYGKIEEVYILDKKLHIIFDSKKVIIDENGNKEIIEKKNTD